MSNLGNKVSLISRGTWGLGEGWGDKSTPPIFNLSS